MQLRLAVELSLMLIENFQLVGWRVLLLAALWLFPFQLLEQIDALFLLLLLLELILLLSATCCAVLTNGHCLILLFFEYLKS